MNFTYKQILVLIAFNLFFLHGQNLQEIEKLKNEYKNALERQSLQKSKEITDAENTLKSTVLPDKVVYSRKDIESLLVNTQNLLKRLDFLEDSALKMPNIGYNIFSQRDSIPFWLNLPIPKDYVLGPGDEIIISVWGETNFIISEKINREGEIYVENIGILNLSDKNLEEAETYTISKFSKVFSTLTGANPQSFIDLSVGELKSVNIHFVGFVNLPGVHMIHPFSNILNGITQAGGVNSKGSLRNIEIIRNNNKILIFDLYDYLFSGKSATEIRLMDQDIVYIPPRTSKIALNGEVVAPGYYETTKNETFEDLIIYAGGKLSHASEKIFVYNESSQNSSRIITDSMISNYIVNDGDSIFISKKPLIERYVKIGGHIKNPGKYPFEDNMSMIDLINATSSLEDIFFKNTIDSSSVKVFRINESGDFPLKLEVGINDQDFKLQNRDHITISRNKYFRDIESVVITGEIKNPGIYPVNNLTTLKSVISSAGGYTGIALKNGIQVFRDTLMVGWNDIDFPLFNGDSLNILKKTGLVMVSGEVNNPGYYSFNNGVSIKDYIRLAGGFSAYAEPRDVYVLYPNGISRPKSGFRKTKVVEGSTIIVNQRTFISSYKQRSALEVFGLIASQAGNFATTLLSLILISNQINGS